MMNNKNTLRVLPWIALRSKRLIPIFILMGAGFLSRKTGILKSGDERVLSAYVYYFALPALSLLNLAETEFTAETFRFMLAGILPVLGILLLSLFLYYTFRLPKHTVYLWILRLRFRERGLFWCSVYFVCLSNKASGTACLVGRGFDCS